LISPVRDVRNRKRLPIWELDVQDSRRIHSQSCVSPSSESSPMAPQSIYCAPKPVGAVAKYLPKQEIFSKILQRVAIQSSSYKEGLAPDRESAWQNGGIKQESINTNSLNCALSNSIEAFPVPVIPQLSAGQVSARQVSTRQVSATKAREVSEARACEVSETRAPEASDSRVREVSESRAREVSESRAREVSESRAREVSESRARDVSESRARKVSETRAREVSETRAREVLETRPREEPSNTDLRCVVASPFSIRDTKKKSQQKCSTEELLTEQGCTQQ